MQQMLRTSEEVKIYHKDEEVRMVGKISTALALALVLASAGIASARPAFNASSERVFGPSVERYDGVTYPHDDERFCYMPSSPCDNNHRVTN
jgi:TRAP-type mannitol/chloroaromatic compound transport system permease small subunit